MKMVQSTPLLPTFIAVVRRTLALFSLLAATAALAEEIPKVKVKEAADTQSRSVRLEKMRVADGIYLVASVITRWRGQELTPEMAAKIGEAVGANFAMATMEQKTSHISCKKILWHLDEKEYSTDIRVESEYDETGEMEKISFKVPYSMLEQLQNATAVTGELCQSPFALSSPQIAGFKQLFSAAKLQDARDIARAIESSRTEMQSP